MTHAEIEALLGAYVLDAVDPEEARQIEEHLATCPRCHAELDAHREVAAALGNFGAAKAPEAIWQRIAGELEAESVEVRGGLPPLVALEGARTVPPRPSRRWLAYGLTAVAAALALVVGLLASRVSDLNANLNQVSAAISKTTVANEAANALLNPKARVVSLTSLVGSRPLAAQIVVLPDGQAYWRTVDLASLPANRTYQLWAFVVGQRRPISLGPLGGRPQWVALHLEPNAERLLVTDEPLGGSPQPTSPPLAGGLLGSV